MNSRATLLPSIALLLALTPTACASNESESAGADIGNFAVSEKPALFSVLPAIENAHGNVEVCVGLVGYPVQARANAAKQVEGLLTDAARKWIALLDGNPLWTFKGKVTPQFVVRDSECPTGLPGFAINVWATAEDFKADYCSRPNYTCSSGAISEYRSMYLGPWNRYKAEDPFDPDTMLHEFGHLLGLGDTYRMPGRNDWEGEQPPSMMNGKAKTLTQDDKLGLWVVLRELKTGVRSCDGFGDEVEMTANDWNALMCAPSAEPQDIHGGPGKGAKAVLPREGIWAYDGYDVGSLAMSIRAVARTKTGYEMTVSAVKNGQPSADGTLYRCNVAGACAASSNPNYRMLVASDASLRMINPSTPAGILVEFSRP